MLWSWKIFEQFFPSQIIANRSHDLIFASPVKFFFLSIMREIFVRYTGKFRLLLWFSVVHWHTIVNAAKEGKTRTDIFSNREFINWLINVVTRYTQSDNFWRDFIPQLRSSACYSHLVAKMRSFIIAYGHSPFSSITVLVSLTLRPLPLRVIYAIWRAKKIVTLPRLYNVNTLLFIITLKFTYVFKLEYPFSACSRLTCI